MCDYASLMVSAFQGNPQIKKNTKKDRKNNFSFGYLGGKDRVCLRRY